MKILLSFTTAVLISICLSCKKEEKLIPSPAPEFASIHFLHRFRAENIPDLLIHRYELRAGQWRFLDSAKTGKDGLVQFCYPVTTEYQLRVVSDVFQKPVYHMVPSRNSGLLTLGGETDCPATYTGSVDYINTFRVLLY